MNFIVMLSSFGTKHLAIGTQILRFTQNDNYLSRCNYEREK